MKLSRFNTTDRANAGVKMHLKDLRTGEPTVASIMLLGMDSDEFASIQDDRKRMFADRAAAGLPDLTRIERDELNCDMLARCTKRWDDLDADDDTPLAFSQEAARTLYKEYPAIREQVNIFIAGRANFVLA